MPLAAVLLDHFQGSVSEWYGNELPQYSGAQEVMESKFVSVLSFPVWHIAQSV
jgi:hypothetical protein